MRGLSGLKRNFGYQMVYRILLVVTPLITSPYLARVLGVEALGQYSASQAFVNYFILFAMLGIENYGNRTVARVQDDKQERSAAFWNIYIIQVIATCCSIAPSTGSRSGNISSSLCSPPGRCSSGGDSRRARHARCAGAGCSTGPTP